MTQMEVRLVWKELLQPPYSPNLVPSDYYFFSKKVNSLDGMRNSLPFV